MNLGFIGTGLMGEPMARRLLEAGHKVTVFNRTRSKAAGLAEAGAAVATSPAAVFEASEAVVIMVSDGPAVCEVVLAEPLLLAGTTVLQMSTIGPGESNEVAAAVVEAGGCYLEAPVLGSIPQATDGSLIIMVGAAGEDYDRWLPVLRHFGPKPRLIGEVGSAAALKLALNQLIASLTTAFSLSLAYVRSRDLEVEAFMEILRSSALFAPTFDKKLDKMLDHDFDDANFPARHLLKDVRLCVKEARSAGLGTEALEGVAAILERTLALGHAESDYSALYEAVEKG